MSKNTSLFHTYARKQNGFSGTSTANGIVSEKDYYMLDDFDNPNAWSIHELDMLEGMGFAVEGDTHMSLKTSSDYDSTQYTISKHKKQGHCLDINGRKHFFKTFKAMLEKIDDLGQSHV
jgi:hypothetical protein